ncbi:MAG TPA: phosphatase PAP2 family protein [Ohtaekwangia sp.]|nr:phosphatase PAP2 family protein [Ohtaekwangia sp.]
MKQRLKRIIAWIRQVLKAKLHVHSGNLPYYIIILSAFILFVIALNVFVELTEELAENNLEQFDSAITNVVTGWRNNGLTVFFVFVTHLGDTLGYAVMITLIALSLFLKHRNSKFIVQTVFVLILATASNVVIKKIIHRERPSLEHLVTVNTLSYPSGHAMSAMAFYGFLIYLTLRYRSPRWQKFVLCLLMMMLILSIGVSRIYLGVHYPSDVAAGFLGGLLWVTFCVIGFNVIELLRERRR